MTLVEATGCALAVAGVYLAAGAVFALLFVTRWAKRLDPQAATGTPGFRVAIFPAACALWPFLLVRLSSRSSPDPGHPLNPEAVRRVQALVFAAVALLAPAVGIVAVAGRDRQLVPAQPAEPAVAAGAFEAFGSDVPIEVAAGKGDRSVVVDVPAALVWPAATLHWSPTKPGAMLPRDAVFLGTLWGPRRLAFALPRNDGWLVAADFADGGKVLGARPVPHASP